MGIASSPVVSVAAAFQGDAAPRCDAQHTPRTVHTNFMQPTIKRNNIGNSSNVAAPTTINKQRNFTDY